MRTIFVSREVFSSMYMDYTGPPYILHTYADPRLYTSREKLMYFLLKKAVAAADSITVDIGRHTVNLHWITR